MKLSFIGVMSVSASACAIWASLVCEPGQSIRMKSQLSSSAPTTADSGSSPPSLPSRESSASSGVGRFSPSRAANAARFSR